MNVNVKLNADKGVKKKIAWVQNIVKSFYFFIVFYLLTELKLGLFAQEWWEYYAMKFNFLCLNSH